MGQELAGPSVRPLRSPTDGWLGTPTLPGYRAGNVVVRLDDLPRVDPDHLYFDLLLLDADDRLQDCHSGPCVALAREQSVDDRARFVRVVAELVRHAPLDARDLSAIGQALTFVRLRGVEADRLVLAAQLLDDACSEGAVVASLVHVLELSLGAEEALAVLRDAVRASANAAPVDYHRAIEAAAAPTANGREAPGTNESALALQVGCVVRQVGKTRARRYLREVTDFALVPTPAVLGM